MVTPTPTQVADLRRKIEARYKIAQVQNCVWMIIDDGWNEITGKDHDDPLDAEAEMEAIIQDEVKAEMEEIER